MGEAGYAGPGGGNVPILFDNVMWDYINRLDCNLLDAPHPEQPTPTVQAWPNPAQDVWVIQSEYPIEKTTLYAFDGHLCDFKVAAGAHQVEIDAAGLSAGVYVLVVQTKTGVEKMRLIKW